MIYIIFITNFILTLFIEGLIIFLLYGKKNLVYYSILCNMLTNPALNLLLLFVTNTLGFGYWISLIILEIIVVLIEAFIYKLLGNMKATKALFISALLNLISFGTGVLVHSL